MTDTGDIQTEVVVIGAGLAGTSAATLLGRRGLDVVLVDTHERYQPEFRAEKLGRPHLDLLDRLDLTATVRPVMTPVDTIEVHRFRRHYADEHRREYGFAYDRVINALRAALPTGVTFFARRVADLFLDAKRQIVTLADGRRIMARIVVIATGLGDAIKRMAGIGRHEIKRSHSLSLGFDLAKPASSFPFETLTAYGEGGDDRLAYMTLFPIGSIMRGNVFLYREASEDWTKQFRRDPAGSLSRLAPDLAARCDGFTISGAASVRPIDLHAATNYQRDGVVILGDAFRTTCPAPGVGIQRVLTDVERLGIHLPGWMRSGPMAAERIASFYDDPVKRATDRRALDASLYSRALITENAPIWAMRRLRNNTARRGIAMASRTFAAAMG